MRARDFILETADQDSIDKIIESFVSSPVGQKYAKHDCKTVTRAFVQWADQNQIPTQVINLAPPSAAFIKKNPQFQGKSGEGDGHIMPIVNGQAIDFTVRQFGVNRPFERPLVTPVANLPSVYGRFGYFTDRPEWFLGGKTHWIGPLNQIPAEIFNQEFGDEILEQVVQEGKIINTYLWHGSRQKIPVLEPRQSVDTGGATGSNQNAIYATSDPKVAIAMGLTTPGSDTGMFPNDPQMVLFSGDIRKGENVYLHRVPFNGPDGKPQFVQGGNSREFHSIPSVKEIKPIEIKAVPVNRYLDLIRKATPADLKLRKKYMKQGVAEVVKMPPTKNSSQGMADWAYQDAQDKKAPLKDSLKGIPTEVYDMGDHLRVFVKDDQGPVLYLALNKFLDGFKSGAVAVEPRGRGKNLAVRVYQAASDTFGRPIYSDTTQTDASRIGIWQKLMTSLPGRVVGYDQRTQEDLPLTATDQGPAVRGNQPVYTQRTAKDLDKPVTGQNRSRTRLLKLLPNQQGVTEVKILSKVKGKGSEPSQLPRYGRAIDAEDEERYLGKQVGRLANYEIWQDWIGGQLSYHLFDPQDRRVVLTSFGSQYKGNPRSYIIHGLYAAPGNPVKAHQFYRALIKDLGMTLVSDRKQSPGGNRVWQRLEAYPDIEVYGYDTRTGEVKNFGARDAEMYAVGSQAAKGSQEMAGVARDLRLVATAR